jgi:type VI secretion system protein ImpG
MDPRLLRLYNRELQYVRELGGEFAKEFPKIAGRLGLEGFECADPYVERLLEGFAFLTARVQLKLESEFPRFTQHLLEAIQPDYLAPTPSMAVVQLQPDPGEGGIAAGFEVPRDTVLRGRTAPSDTTACEYRTAQPVTLLPIELTEARYLPSGTALAALGLPEIPGARAGIALKLRATAGLTFDNIALQDLRLYVRGSEQLPARIYEQLLAHGRAVVVRPPGRPVLWQEVLPADAIGRVGFKDDEALLPSGPRSFAGYRLLREYFAFPQRFLFVDIEGLLRASRRCNGPELEVVVVLDRSEPALVNAMDVSNLALFCTPAVNLFPRRADRIHLDSSMHEYHVVPDRTRPMDFEVYAVRGVSGIGGQSEQEQVFRPLYALADRGEREPGRGYYTVLREPRRLSERQRRVGPRSSYVGSEVFIGIVDVDEAPFSTDLRQLAVETLCTNRDLPLHMPLGLKDPDFTLESGAPVAAARVLVGPTAPHEAWATGDPTWRLISHLSLNYLSLVDSDTSGGAAGLRALLGLYADLADATSRRQVDGVVSVSSRPLVRRLPGRGPITFGRGLEVLVTCDESAFEGTGVFLLGAILERFFARYVSINSFTETVVNSITRGEVMRWPARLGQRHLI